ncbi:MAG: type II toxin-antitoxin system RelE/ParE family toxin [Gammaproteobacteria bacterium]
MRLKWTRRALNQLVAAQDYIAEDNPAAAHEIGQRIHDALALLLTQPEMARLGRIAGTHEWVVDHTPYFIVYRIQGDTLQVLRVIHGKQDWPPGR